jgi:hypothetical protein
MTVSLVNILLSSVICAYGSYMAYMSDVTYMASALAALGGLVVLMSVIGFWGAKNETHSMLLGVRAAYDYSLCEAISLTIATPLFSPQYFYITCFLMMLMFLFSVSALAFQDTFAVYVEHHWEDLGQLKSQACCTDIDKMNAWLERNFTMLGVVGLVTCVFMAYGCLCAVRILTVPIIMKNMLVVINAMFFAAAFLIMMVGVFALGHDEVEAGNKWIAILFIAMSCFIIVLSTIGVIGARNKSRMLLMGYIMGTSLLLLLAICSGVGGFVFASSLDQEYIESQVHLMHLPSCTSPHASPLLTPPTPQSQGNDIACTVGLHGCTNCSDYKVPKMAPCLLSDDNFAPNRTSAKGYTRGIYGEEGFTKAECGASGNMLVCLPQAGSVFSSCRYTDGSWRCCGDFTDPNDLSCDYFRAPNSCGMRPAFSHALTALTPTPTHSHPQSPTLFYLQCLQSAGPCFEWGYDDIEITITTNIKLLGLISFLLIVFVVSTLTPTPMHLTLVSTPISLLPPPPPPPPPPPQVVGLSGAIVLRQSLADYQCDSI